MNAPRQPTYQEQIAQWRTDRMRQQVQNRVEELKYDYAETTRERDQAIAENRMDDAEVADNYAQDLENEYRQYYPPQPPQMDQRLQRWHAANKDYVDRLIARHGNEKASAYLNMIDQKLTAPRNTYEPARGGLGLQRYSPDYFERGQDLLELYSEGATGERYTANDTLTAGEAAKVSGVSPESYNRSAQVLNQQGRYSWQQGKK